MNDDQAADLFTRLGAGIPDVRPAAAELITAGRRGRRRRTTRVVLSAALAVLVVVGGGAVVANGLGHGAGPAPTSTPSPEGATRLVGRGRAVVSVPTDWPSVTGCLGGRPGYVYFPGEIRRCPQQNPRGVLGSVVIAKAGGTSGLSPAPAVSGVAVLQDTVSCRRNVCEQQVTVPSQDVRFVLSGDRVEVARLRASLRLLPVGSTTVPATYIARTTSALRRVLAKVGLTMPAGIDRPNPGIASPPVGSVAPVGTTVVLSPGDPVVSSAAQLVGQWTLLSLGPDQRPIDRVTAGGTLTFTQRRVILAAGCDRIADSFTVSATGAFSIGGVGSVRQCRGVGGRSSPPTLAHVAGLVTERGGSQLVLLNRNGGRIATYLRLAAPSGSVTSFDQLVGSWTPLEMLGHYLDATRSGVVGSLRFSRGQDAMGLFETFDGCTQAEGTLAVRSSGGIRATQHHQILSGACSPVPFLDNRRALVDASRARITEDGRLELIGADRRVLATYQRDSAHR